MPLPLAVMGVSAAISAAISAISEFQKSGDPQALAAAKQARGESIMEAMQRGMSRQEAEAQVDQNIQDAIVRNDYEFDASNVVGAGVVGGALGGLGSIAMSGKLAAQAMGKLGLGRGAVGPKYAKPAGPQKPMTMDDALARAEAGPSATRRTIAPSPEPAPFRAPEEVLTQAPGSRIGTPNAVRAAEDMLTGRASELPPRSPWTPPGTGMPPMMMTNMLEAQAAQDIARRAATQQEWYRRLMAVSGD